MSCYYYLFITENHWTCQTFCLTLVVLPPFFRFPPGFVEGNTLAWSRFLPLEVLKVWLVFFCGDYDFKLCILKAFVQDWYFVLEFWYCDLKGCNQASVWNKVIIFQVLFICLVVFCFCLLKCSTKVKAFPLWVTLTEVGCYTWYQSWRLADWVKLFKTIFKTVLKGSIFKNKAYFWKT